MKAVQYTLMGIGILGIIIVIAAITGVFLYTLTPSLKNDIAIMPVTYDAVQSYDQKLMTFKQQVRDATVAKEEKRITLTVTEEEVNSKLVEMLAEGALPAKEVLINFEDDFCVTYAALINPGIDAKVAGIAQMEIEDADLKIHFTEFHMGKLPTPKSMDAAVNELVNVIAKLQEPFKDLPVEMSDVEIDEGKFTLEVITTTVQ